MKEKTYLGDGAYAEIICGEIHLTTSNGETTTNRVVLGHDMLERLVSYVEGEL